MLVLKLVKFEFVPTWILGSRPGGGVFELGQGVWLYILVGDIVVYLSAKN